MFWKGTVLRNRPATLQLFIYFILLIVSRPVQSQVVINTEGEIYTWTRSGMPHIALALDTTLFHELYKKFAVEVAKKGELDISVLREYGHKAIAEARKVNYFLGLGNVYTGMGSAFVEKYTIDSAQYYSMLAIQNAKKIGDKRLLAQAHYALGWSYIYDNSDYESSVRHISEACRLAQEAKDTTLYLYLTGRLNKVYFIKTDYRKGYESCLALIDYCTRIKDTSQLLYNYSVLATLLSEMSLRDKEMQIVRKVLQLKPHVADTTDLYLINDIASKGFLRSEVYDSALYYARHNIPLAKAARRYPVVFFNISKAHLETEQLDSARFYYNLIYDVQKENSMYINIYQYLDMGIIEFKSGNYDKALSYYKMAEDEIKKPPLPTQRDIYKALYEYYDFKDEHAVAFHYLEKYKVMADSVQTTQNAMFAGISLVEKEFANLETQVQLLKKDKQLQAALAEKQKQEEAMMVGSMAVVMIMAALGFARWRKNKILKNKQALLNERLRISRELHDEVGSTLSGVSMFSHLAKDQLKIGDLAQTENSLNIIQKSTGEMVNKLSDIVWLINPEQDTISELFQRLEEYARQMVSARNMRVRIDIPPELSETHIKLEVRRNIYLFFKEAINNAVKYSEGSLLELEAKIINNKIRFSIRDDGKGFDEMTIRRGNGLANMMKRAEDIGANCRIEARPNKGVNIEMHYKLTH